MAKQVGIIQFNGALGETIGAPSMKGYQVIKKRPVAVHNPNTLKQRTQRGLFSAATATSAGTPLDAIAGLRPMAKAKKCSVRNAFTKTLLNDGVFSLNMIVPGQSSTTANYPSVKFSKGAEPIPNFRTADFETPQEINVPVTLPSRIDSKCCNIIVVVYCPDAAQFSVQVIPCNHNNSAITNLKITEIPANWIGMKVHVWAYLQNFLDENNINAYYDARMFGASIDVHMLESQASYSNTYYVGQGNIG